MILDHKGNKYSSVRAMYRAYGLTDWLYYQRKRKGWHIIEILETPVRKQANNNSDDRYAYERKINHLKVDSTKQKTIKLIRRTKSKISGGYVECREYGYK